MRLSEHTVHGKPILLLEGDHTVHEWPDDEYDLALAIGDVLSRALSIPVIAVAKPGALTFASEERAARSEDQLRAAISTWLSIALDVGFPGVPSVRDLAALRDWVDSGLVGVIPEPQG
jgi:hypothetical protein